MKHPRSWQKLNLSLHCLSFSEKDDKNLEEVLLFEAVGCAGLEVHLDVLPLLERGLHRVDLLH